MVLADPRFKEVRGFLTETYVNAVRSWGLDGLKLDFIDAFKLNGKSLEYDPRRDYTSLEDAIDALMNEVTAALREINPEILIEVQTGLYRTDNTQIRQHAESRGLPQRRHTQPLRRCGYASDIRKYSRSLRHADVELRRHGRERGTSVCKYFIQRTADIHADRQAERRTFQNAQILPELLA